ncbi:hypothetical protein RSAG8_06346, partial [Rhizoctonia solani AG-8 WAC10335]
MVYSQSRRPILESYFQSKRIPGSHLLPATSPVNCRYPKEVATKRTVFLFFQLLFNLDDLFFYCIMSYERASWTLHPC